jgi:hypothetical protein
LVTLEHLVGAESAALAAELARIQGWLPSELTDRLAAAGAALLQGVEGLPKGRRQYLETAVHLQETLRRFELLSAEQRELETLEAELEAEAAQLADGHAPAQTAVSRAQSVLARHRAGDDPETEDLRTHCHWGLAGLRLEHELARVDPASLDLALRLGAHALGSRRASLHYKLFTYEHDNMVLQMRIGALTSRIAHLRADLKATVDPVGRPTDL